jgi:trigger factor
MKTGEKKELAIIYPEDYPDKKRAGTPAKLVLELKGLRENKRPEINDELAQDISDAYETLDDLKKDIRKRLEESAKNRVHALTVEALMEQVVEKSVIDLPESMIRAEQDRLWQQFAARFHADEKEIEKILAERSSSKEQLYAEWRPKSEKSLKIQLCIQKMLEAEKIEASEEELDAFLAEQAKSASMSFEEMKEYYAKNKLTGVARHEVREKKLFEQVLEKNTVVTGKEIGFLDALGGSQ